MKLVPSIDLGFHESKVSKCQILSMQYLFSFLVLVDVSGVSGADWKEDKQASSSSQEQIMHSTNKSKDALIFLNWMVNKHVPIDEFSITQEKFQPSLILRFGKIVLVFQELVPHTLNGMINVTLICKGHIWLTWLVKAWFGTRRGTPSNPKIFVCKYPMSCTWPETLPACTRTHTTNKIVV